MVYGNVEELLTELREDRKTPGRFPVRFILVDDLGQWQELIQGIRNLIDGTVLLSSLCSGSDLAPNLDQMISKVKGEMSRSILVLPLAEALRLDKESHRYLAILAGIEDIGTRRIYVPLFRASDIFFEQMEKVTRFGQDESCKCYRLVSESSATSKRIVEVLIVPPGADLVTLRPNACSGLKAYLEHWETGGSSDIVLKTQFVSSYSDIYGTFTLKAFNSIYALLGHFLLDLKSINQEDGTDKQWIELLQTIKQGETLGEVFRRVFKTPILDIEILFSKWGNFSAFQQWLLWIWCRFELKSGYLHHAVTQSRSLADLREEVAMGVFTMSGLDLDTELEWLRERRELLANLNVTGMPDSFWAKLKAIGPLDQLKALPGISLEEKRHAVTAVQQLLKDRVPPDRWQAYLAISYPELAWYLEDDSILVNDKVLFTYFYEYRRSKLMNEVTDEILNQASNVFCQETQFFLRFPTRKIVLDELRTEWKNIYWIDGLGVEWLGLIYAIIKHRYPGIKVEARITRSNLPTITECNRGWEDDSSHEEFREFDEYVHSSSCRYPDYMVREIELIEEIIHNAVGLLTDTGYLVMTSDHGETRMPAILKAESVSLPEGAEPRRFGRYCDNVNGSSIANHYIDCVSHEDKLIFASHRRFKVSGSVQGEVHGGATLEEVLVPIILLERRESAEDQQTECKILTPLVRLNAEKKGILRIAIKPSPNQLVLVVAGKSFEGREDEGYWEFTLVGLAPKKYRAKLYATKPVEIEFELQLRGMSHTNMDI